jgi:hypothetical protein
MANWTAADLVKYQAKITQQMQAGELRFRDPAVFNVFRRNTELMLPSHNEIKNAAKRTTGEVNYVGRKSRSLGTGGEIYNHSGTKGESAVLVPSWTAYDDKFAYSLKQANSSLYSLDEEIMAEMTNLNLNFIEGLESAGASFVHNNRSGVNVYGRQGTFNATNDVFEITEDVTNERGTGYRAIQIAKSAMDVNKWSGPMTAFCDTVMYDKMQYLAAQGSQNANNTAFQYSDVEFVKSPELDALAVALTYTDGYMVMAPQGTLSVLDWIPVQNRQGVVTQQNVYGSLIHPTLGIALATHSYEQRADESSLGGENQDVRTEVQMFSYLSFNHAPLTTAEETPLQAFGFVAPTP